jgi:mevalonate kinase
MLNPRNITASAPGKTILFGEHAVVYGKPAIAAAVDKRAYVSIEKREDNRTHVTIDQLGITGYLNIEKGTIKLDNGQKNEGILKYVLIALMKTGSKDGLEITINMEIPVGAGLGSSGAVTVATVKAASSFKDIELTRMK